jgi:acyl-CoA hydrolase
MNDTIVRHADRVVVQEVDDADLRGRTAPERRKALLAIAAPEHRAALKRAGS